MIGFFQVSMSKSYERYFATSTDGLIYANIVYEKLKTGILGCYSGVASNDMQIKYFFINNNNEVLITDDETVIDPKMINNDLERCYALQGQRSQFEDYGDDNDEEDGSTWSEVGKLFSSGGTKDKERQMILTKTNNFDEEIIRKLQEEWTLKFFIE